MAKIIIIANRVYIPCDIVNEKDLIKHYERHLFIDQSCKKCILFKKGIQRPGILVLKQGDNKKVLDCSNCSWNAYTGYFKSWSKVFIKGKYYYSLPSGNLNLIKKNLGVSFKSCLDLRCNIVTRYPLKFTGKLFNGKEKIDGHTVANQIQIVKDYFNSVQSGYIVAKARTGKSVIAIYIICKLKKPTIILVHEKLLLDQFLNHFKTKTNLLEMEAKTGKSLVVIAKTEKDLKSKAPYLLVNYQKFISELGVERFTKYLQKKYSLLIIDEAHRGGSDNYLKVINRMDCKRRIGLTATNDRKDGKWSLVEEMIGPMLAKSSVVSLLPVCKVIKTNYVPKRQWKGIQAYNKSCSFLAANKERNVHLVKAVFKDLRENPLNSIVIPVKKVQHAKLLVRMINKQAIYNNINKQEDWNEEIAEVLWYGSDKQSILSKARRFKTRVVVAIEKFVKDGIDVPAWNIMHVLFPCNNKVTTEQSTARILTPNKDKPTPILYLWNDPIDIMINCLRATYVDSYKILGYKFGKEDQQILEDLVNSKKVGKSWINRKTDINDNWNTTMINSVKTR